MIDKNNQRLVHLLPALYRQRDIGKDDVLRAFMAVMENESNRVETNIKQLYDNWFIETCETWVIPYIGDLLGIRGISHEKGTVFNQRAMVANILAYRRRKGTLAALEGMIHDVTGWHARAMEFFDLLTITQNLNHIRKGKGGLIDIRTPAARKGAESPFDTPPHTVEVRRIASRRGMYNISNIGLFIWRLSSYAMTGSTACEITSPGRGRYTFHPLGIDTPLFNKIETVEGFSRVIEENIATPIRPGVFNYDLQEYRKHHAGTPEQHRPAESRHYGADRSLMIIKDGTPVTPINLIMRDLSGWDRPSPGKVAVDVRLGRFIFAEKEAPEDPVKVNYHYGFSADIGGGPYDRRDTLADTSQATWQTTVTVDEVSGKTGTLQRALELWAEYCQIQEKPRGIIRILDNGAYKIEQDIHLPSESCLTIEAADGKRPCVIFIDTLNIETPKHGAGLTFSGLLMQGQIQIKGKDNLELALIHCTFIPGQTSVKSGVVAGTHTPNLEVIITHSIVGPIRLSAECKHLKVSDSILDGSPLLGQSLPAIAANDAGDLGPRTTLERTTIFGQVHVQEIALASDVLFTDTVHVQRRQTGFIRYSFVPVGSGTPRRFRCQPDLIFTKRMKELNINAIHDLPNIEKNLILDYMNPSFSSVRFGQPGYAQLNKNCPREIQSGAEDGSETGAFNHLKQNQRETNINTVLNEYLRAGLEPGCFYIT